MPVIITNCRVDSFGKFVPSLADPSLIGLFPRNGRVSFPLGAFLSVLQRQEVSPTLSLYVSPEYSRPATWLPLYMQFDWKCRSTAPTLSSPEDNLALRRFHL